MKQDMIVVLDLGSTENTVVARQIRDLGVYSEIHPHDISVEQLNQMQIVKVFGKARHGGECLESQPVGGRGIPTT